MEPRHLVTHLPGGRLTALADLQPRRMSDTGAMTRLRGIDGQRLPTGDARLSVTGAGGGGDLTTLLIDPHALRAFTQAEGTALDADMRRAETDETLSVDAQGTLIRAVLLRQALLVGLDAYAAAPDTAFLELLGDVNTTLDRLGLPSLTPALTRAKVAAGLGELERVPLLPDEDPHAVGLILDRADLASVPVDDAVHARLRWAGYRAPQVTRSPLNPLRAALTPPATRVPARIPAEQNLRRLAQSALEGERNAALLLTVNGRDRLENAPLIGVLDLTLVLLLTLERHHRACGTDDAVTRRLRHWHAELHAQLGQPDLPRARQFRRRPHTDLPGCTRDAQRRLRALRAARQGPLSPGEALSRQTLWASLDHLDAQLTQGLDPQADPDLNAHLILTTLLALTSVARAPGMSLPVLVETAVRIADLDPLWAWQATQPPETGDGLLRHELDLSVQALTAASHLSGTPLDSRARTALRLAAGHLLATVRRAGLRLPGQAFLETYLQPFGSLQALPLNPDRQQQLRADLAELLGQAAKAVRAEQPTLPASEGAVMGVTHAHAPDPPVSPAPPDEPDVDLTEPPHVQAARALLRGRRVVLLGGVLSPSHRAALTRSLHLRELDWIGSDAYAHGTHARAHVTPDTALVILAVRWMAHAHNTLRDVAQDLQVPYVMHPGGLSPSSAAWQIMHQASRQLGAPGAPHGPNASGS